jgi:hypothetical protein
LLVAGSTSGNPEVFRLYNGNGIDPFRTGVPVKTLLTALALLLLAPSLGSAQTVWPDEGPRSWPARPTTGAITSDDLRTHIYALADDSAQGRMAGTEGNWKATEYIAAHFRRLGLRPAGDDGTFFQELELRRIAYDRGAVRFAAAGTQLQAGSQWVPIPASGSLRTRGDFDAQNVSTVFGGRYADTSVPLDPNVARGKVVVFLAPTAAGTDLRAQEAGAVAFLIVTGSPSAGAVAQAFEPSVGFPPAPSSDPAAAIVAAAAVQRLFDRPLDQVAVGTVGGMISGSWAPTAETLEFPARNVIGILPGSDPALRGQYVLVGAHNDHEGPVVEGDGTLDHDSLRAFNRVMRPQGANDRPGAPTAAQQRVIDSLIARARSIRPVRRDSVMNGADDDASGTAVLIEIAERFATEPAPARSLIFISHAAEEGGLLGSDHFVEHPTVPLDSIVAAHNMDMVGNGAVTDVRFGGPAQVQMLGARRLSADFGDMIDSLNAVRAETMAIDYSWDRTNALNRFCRSDQVNYFRKVIPVTYFSTGYSLDYHQATDEPQYIDYDKAARVGRFVHEIMASVADRPARLRILAPELRDMSAQC